MKLVDFSDKQQEVGVEYLTPWRLDKAKGKLVVSTPHRESKQFEFTTKLGEKLKKQVPVLNRSRSKLEAD